MASTIPQEFGFDHERESKQHYIEVLEFVKRDIESARHMAELAPSPDHRDRLFDSVVKRYLRSLQECLDTATKIDKKDQPNFVRITLEGFPILVRHLTSALQQRREQYFPRPFAPPIDHNVFAPSEATLDYPVTVRAAEALSEDFHARLEPFYRAIDPECLPPLVNISGAGTTKLETPAISTWQAGDRVTSLRRYASLMCITLPRWSSQHVRTFAAAAHEHMHRLLHITQIASRDIGDELDRLTVSIGIPSTPEESQLRQFRVAERFERFYGKPIIDTLNLRNILVEHLTKLFDRLAIPTPFLDQAILNTSAARDSLRSIIVRQHATELMADIGAVVIAGPAFPFTYRALYSGPLGQSATDLEQMNLQRMPSYAHPPWIVRMSLMIAMLRHLGFHATADKLSAGLKPAESAIASLSVVREYVEVIRSASARYLFHFADLVGDLAEAAVPGHSYHLARRGITEDNLGLLWERISDDVEKRGRYLPGQLDDVRPADLINAIWTKRNKEGGARAPQHRLAWRMALRNCLRGNV